MVEDDGRGWFWRLGARLRDMGGIQIGNGTFNIANFLSLIAMAAVLWFGNLVTGDHEKISEIASSVKNLDTIQGQLATTNTLIIGFQHDQAEITARLNCLQGVGASDGCRLERRHQ